MRSILSASVVRPAWEVGGLRVEAPDEDAFTLGVNAVEGLGPPDRPNDERMVSRLHLVGRFASAADWAFAEALGLPRLEVRRHPPSGPGLWGALAAASHDEGPRGREVVLASESAVLEPDASGTTRIRQGAGAVAFLLGTEPGLAVLRHGFQGRVPGRSVSMRELVVDWLAAVGLPRTGGRGEVVFDAGEESSRWQAAWEETAPGVVVTMVGAIAANGMPAGVHSGALLWELGRRLRTDGVGLVGESGGGGTGFAGFRLDGPVHWIGDWGVTSPGVPPPDSRFLERHAPLEAVSQGAYVPHPRYLENLASRWRLVGERCPRCRTMTFPSTGRCRSCLRTEGLIPEPLPRNGATVEATTTIAPGAQPTEFDAQVGAGGAYDVVIAAFGAGVRATFQVTDTAPGRIRVGDPVRLVLRRLYPMEGEWRYGLKAVRLDPTGDVPPSPTAVRRTPTRPPRRASSGAPTARRATARARVSRAGSRRRPER